MDLTKYDELWQQQLHEIAYSNSMHRYTRVSLMSAKDRLESVEKQFGNSKKLLIKDGLKKADKLDQKVKISTTGYQKRAKSLYNDVKTKGDALEQSIVSLKCFKALRISELTGIRSRIDALKQEVEIQQKKEQEFQVKYQSLADKRDALLKQLGVN